MIKLIKNAEVFSSVGEKIGLLDRVVLDPSTKKVSHIIVKEGIVFSSSKVIPISYVNLDGKRITLTKNAMELDDLPDFEEELYVTLNQPEEESGLNVESVYWYPPINLAWWSTGGHFWGPKPEYVLKKEKVIPEGTVALEEGAKVIGSDGEDVGAVEQVIVETSEERATHIVVVSGLISKEYKLIPTPWISDVTEEKIYLHISSDTFKHLPERQLAQI